MTNTTRAQRTAAALTLTLAAAVTPAVATAAPPKPAMVVLTYDCSNMRNPQLSVQSTRHATVSFVRLSKYRWRLRAYPELGHPIRTDLWEDTPRHRISASRGRLVRASLEWVIPIKTLEGC